MGAYDDLAWPCALMGEQEFPEEHDCFGAFCREPADWQDADGAWWCPEHGEERREVEFQARRWVQWGEAMAPVFEDNESKEG